ncbi:alpha/beta fold hydrolase [Shouchella lehensis]|uniref:Alpha/beta hydrolase n=1 Tax=Shouchella lehensis G1 TaxID=1246626 RepID=A0A060LT71_9BACI|nr:alpha/beta fold hydrolase [Shouchella lehensis]AIC93175.1 hypothetical protein BleG1_0567 [Shouchella lehensis G1]
MKLKKANLFKRIHSEQNKNTVVFIHGYSGDHEDTWRIDKNTPGLIEAVQHDSDLRHFNIYSFGYVTGFTWGHYDFKTIARVLYSQIRAELPTHNIFFVTHSMGGLVAQQYIVDRCLNFETEDLSKVKGVAFLGVPFEGSKLSFLALNKQGKTLKSGNPLLQDLKNNWEKYITRGGVASLPRTLQHEFHRLSVIGVKDQVVIANSSNPFHIDSQNVFEVDETHGSLCKGDYNSPVFKHIKDMLIKASSESQSTMVLGINGYDRRKFEGADYTVDWSEYFDISTKPRLLPDADTWSNKIIPSITPASEYWVSNYSRRGGRIRVQGKFCLTGGLLLGNRFSRTKGVKLEVEHYSEIWDSDASASSLKISYNTTPGNEHHSNTAVVILSVSNNIHSQVQTFLENLEGVDYREVHNLTPGNGPGQESIKSDSEAVSYAKSVKEKIDNLQAQGITEILLFVNAPLSLSIIIGHWLTATCPIQTFEYDGTSSYKYSCKI